MSECVHDLAQIGCCKGLADELSDDWGSWSVVGSSAQRMRCAPPCRALTSVESSMIDQLPLPVT